MRRTVLIMLMLILPLQWSWAAVAEACRHEPAGLAQQHLGHHEHTHLDAERAVHAANAAGVADAADPSQGDVAPTCDADCTTCHGQGSLGHAQSSAWVPVRSATLMATPYVRHVPDAVIDQPLRPPLPHLV